jgi:phytoene dehydrogenase-like protein
MMIHLALDEPLGWKVEAELSEFAYVHVALTLEHMTRAYDQAMPGLLPIDPVLVVGQAAAIDPSRAAAGKHVLWVHVLVLPAIILGDAAGQASVRNWNAARARFAARVLDILERYAQGTKSRILGSAVYSPSNLESENPCLIGGDNPSDSHHLNQNLLFRPVAGYSRYSTPVPELHLCGAATWPGAGAGAGSGSIMGKMLAG